MPEIKNVVLAGAGGAVGPAILKALIDANFNVTVLQRAGSKTEIPSGVKVLNPDFDSVESLVEAHKGADAAISTFGALGAAQQGNLAKAAVQAGVYRLIPSEFGSDTTNPKAKALPVYADKVKAQELLQGLAASGKVTYTLIFNGPIVDWGIRAGLLINTKTKSAELYDGGDVKFSNTTSFDIGKAVVGVLKHPEETKNRAVYVQSAVTTQNNLINVAKKAGVTGDWTTTTKSTEELEKHGYEEFQKLISGQEADPTWPFDFIKRAVWGEGFGGVFEKVDNDLLGIKELGDDGAVALLKAGR